MGYVERFGIGIIRIQEAMAEAGLPAPKFDNRPDWFEVTLSGPASTFMQEEHISTLTRPASLAAPQRTEFRLSQPWHSQVWTLAGVQQRI